MDEKKQPLSQKSEHSRAIHEKNLETAKGIEQRGILYADAVRKLAELGLNVVNVSIDKCGDLHLTISPEHQKEHEE